MFVRDIEKFMYCTCYRAYVGEIFEIQNESGELFSGGGLLHIRIVQLQIISLKRVSSKETSRIS